jgi:hypothetical protein
MDKVRIFINSSNLTEDKMVETISIKSLSSKEKMLLLKELGYDSDGIFVLDQEGEKVIDGYINEPVKMDNMMILPGSTIVIDNNPLSIASFLEEHPDAF